MWEKILNLYFRVKLFLGGGKFILGKSYILIAYIFRCNFCFGGLFSLGKFVYGKSENIYFEVKKRAFSKYMKGLFINHRVGRQTY